MSATREKACEGKIAYDKRSARTLVNHSKEPLRAYHCRWCDAWHVGHRLGRNGLPRR